MIRLALVKLAGALYLLYLPFRHFFGEQETEEGRTVPSAKPWLGLSPFWATVVKVELTDIVFAVDSIVVAVAMSPKTWVVLSGGILGIIAMRLVIGQLLAVVERYPILVDGAFVIIAWVGGRLLVQYLHQEGFIALGDPRVARLRRHGHDLRGRAGVGAHRRTPRAEAGGGATAMSGSSC